MFRITTRGVIGLLCAITTFCGMERHDDSEEVVASIADSERKSCGTIPVNGGLWRLGRLL